MHWPLPLRLKYRQIILTCVIAITALTMVQIYKDYGIAVARKSPSSSLPELTTLALHAGFQGILAICQSAQSFRVLCS
jgi:hypothetical protein